MKTFTRKLLVAGIMLFSALVSMQAQEIWNGTVASSFDGGTGTESDPYKIRTASQLCKLGQDVAFGNSYTDTYFILTDDIMLNDTTNWQNWSTQPPARKWNPIGESNTEPFRGIFDGNGYTINGIYRIYNDVYYGLFGYLGDGGKIQNLGIRASYYASYKYIGGICGYNYKGTISNCYFSGTIGVSPMALYSSSYIGGICGWNDVGTITNCRNSGTISVTDANATIGGICGLIRKGAITNCHNSGTLHTKAENEYPNFSVGGIYGDGSAYDAQISNCYNTGTLILEEKQKNAGGICGYNNGSYITNCYSTGSIEAATGGKVGNISGYNGGDKYITNCYYIADNGYKGIGYNSGGTVAKTEEEFASGEVAYLLQSNIEGQTWGQSIGNDKSPLLTSDEDKIVYQLTLVDGTDTEFLYANSGAFTLPVPERDNFTFLGWFTEESGGERVPDNSEISADGILYAQWEENTSTAAYQNDENSFNVTGSNGKLQISGTDADVSVYDLQGLLVYHGPERSITLPAGIYIVKVDGQALKIRVW